MIVETDSIEATPLLNGYKPTVTQTILTHRGEVPFDQVGLDDCVPEIPMDKTERVLRALTVMGLESESDLILIHGEEFRRGLTRFMLPSEIGRYLRKSVTSGKCRKDDIDAIWFEIKDLRPSRDHEGSSGLRPWDGTLAYHHEWDIEIYRSRATIQLPGSEPR